MSKKSKCRHCGKELKFYEAQDSFVTRYSFWCLECVAEDQQVGDVAK